MGQHLWSPRLPFPVVSMIVMVGSGGRVRISLSHLSEVASSLSREMPFLKSLQMLVTLNGMLLEFLMLVRPW